MLIIPVTDDETLYRRVPCIEGLYVIQADGSVKVSSAAFSDRSFRPSVDRAELCHNDPRVCYELLVNEGYGKKTVSQ